MLQGTPRGPLDCTFRIGGRRTENLRLLLSWHNPILRRLIRLCSSEIVAKSHAN